MAIDFKEIEKKWLTNWETKEKTGSQIDKTKGKKYVLVEFPYPSGSGLHVGHAFSFTGADVYARFKRMQGYEVMFPMGWDAFGLPTENFAIKTKRKPQDVTKENTDRFRSQMKALGFSFDWEREVNTTDPAYYKWTQWIFIKLFEKGLAYKKEMPINWCPSCKIGLANEEVLSKEGKNVCERCGAEVSKRNISQWVVKITDYADKLVDGLEKTAFIEKVKQAQINWIGKSEGAKIKFKIQNPPLTPPSKRVGQDNSPFFNGESGEAEGGFDVEVFTTRPDTIFGATFMVIAPEHPLVASILQNPPLTPPSKRVGQDNSPFFKGESGEAEGGFDIEAIRNYVINARKKTDLERQEVNKEKTGVFSGLYAVNPATGKEIPIWISDFVLATYGTGAIMSVPAHDERDNEFAKKFGLEIISAYDENEELVINSDFLNGLNKTQAFEKACEWIKEKGIGEKTATYHLRDWIFSRQHYWGEPIPMINCPTCAKALAGKPNAGWVPVAYHDLPITLPEVEHYEPTDDGQSPLSQMTEWTKTTCPKCGGEATRETDTMPNWAGSDWYYLAYIFADKLKGTEAAFAKATDGRSDIFVDIFSASREELKKWLPIDVYIGGDEHNVLHLLYSRFIYKFLYDLGVLPEESPEPYYKRLSHGVILGPDGARMSKSKGNVIVPEVVADKYGVDVVRMYLMFMGPFDATMAWNEKTLMGIKRFLDRMDVFINKQISNTEGNEGNFPKVRSIINKTIKKVGDDFEQNKYNTAIAAMMELLNSLNDIKELILSKDTLKTIIKLMAPVAPYMAEEWFSKLESKSVHETSWPLYEDKYLIEDKITVAVAINGKVRAEMQIDSSKIKEESEIIAIAMQLDKLKPWIEGKTILKKIYVLGKMVNLVVG